MQVKHDCLRCKGRLWCKASFCPILRRMQSLAKTVKHIEKPEFSGSAPGVFVGRFGYPNINVGILSTNTDNSILYDDPRAWASQNMQIPEIIDFRTSLINSRFKANVKETNRTLETSQEVAMAKKPVETDILLKDKPKFRISFNSNAPPMGPNASLEKVDLRENPHIPAKVEKVFSESDRKAADSMAYLFDKGFDENFLSRILSVGTLGVKKQRKLVPTRWAITATDDTLGKDLINEIKNFKESDYEFYFGDYLGNYYIIMFFPDVWSYELFETYMPKTAWNVEDKINYMTDHEFFEGRKSYAENCVGGYYSVRLAILEKLKSIKKQATVLTLRFITDDYAVPLGVWVTREAARKALSNKPIRFNDKETMLAYCRALVKKKWGFDADKLYKESVLLNFIKTQTKLSKFA
ncbi:Nre family DNA repair protein [Candidatus Woesearchaeota archaeon]|nr:Nre family DNA repair protein [Candidatus Woesearchaeota archaeon]